MFPQKATNFLQTMIPPSDYLQVQQCCPSTREDKYIDAEREDKYIDAASEVEMDFDIVPYPISPTEGEKQERAHITNRFGDAWSNPCPSYYRQESANITNRFGDAWSNPSPSYYRQERANTTTRFGDTWSNPSPSYYFRPIDEASSMSSEMDSDSDDLSIPSNEISSSDGTQKPLWYEDIFSQSAVLQQNINTDDTGNTFVRVIGLEAEDLRDQNFMKENE